MRKHRLSLARTDGTRPGLLGSDRIVRTRSMLAVWGRQDENGVQGLDGEVETPYGYVLVTSSIGSGGILYRFIWRERCYRYQDYGKPGDARWLARRARAFANAVVAAQS